MYIKEEPDRFAPFEPNVDLNHIDHLQNRNMPYQHHYEQPYPNYQATKRQNENPANHLIAHVSQNTSKQPKKRYFDDIALSVYDSKTNEEHIPIESIRNEFNFNENNEEDFEKHSKQYNLMPDSQQNCIFDMNSSMSNI